MANGSGESMWRPRAVVFDLVDRVQRHGVAVVMDGLIAAGGFILADVLRFGTHIRASDMAVSAAVLFCAFALANYHFGLHRRVWRYVNLLDVAAMGGAVAVATTIFSVIDLLVQPLTRPYWLSTVPNGAVLAFLLLVLAKLSPRLREKRAEAAATSGSTSGEGCARALVVGAGKTGVLLARDFHDDRGSHVRVVGFIDADAAKRWQRLNGVPVLGTYGDIARLVTELEVDLIAIAIPSSTRDELDELIAICQGTGARVQIVPSLSEIATQPHRPLGLRELDITDLLGRDEVRLDVAACANYLQDKVVLVTGAAGSIGSELCRQLLHLRPSRLVLLDTNETGLFDLHAELGALGAGDIPEVCIADITDEHLMDRVFARVRPSVVFHAAAYKHVPLLESHPSEAIKANVLGTAILCRAAHLHEVERFVFISSDKAVAAANNLGYSKRVGELLVRAFAQGSATLFCAVRFGNVVGSRGSVVPTFERQIAAGGPITVTHPEVTRFFMSIPEAACLVIEAAASAAGGSIYMLDMGQPVRIVDLAEKLIRLRGLRVGKDVAIRFTGLRPGEKMHEELTSALENTVPTANAKIMGVIDPRPVSRAGMESMVRTLVLLARRAGTHDVSDALRMVAEGEAPAIPVRREERALLGPYMLDASDVREEGAWSRSRTSPAATQPRVAARSRSLPLPLSLPLPAALDNSSPDSVERSSLEAAHADGSYAWADGAVIDLSARRHVRDGHTACVQPTRADGAASHKPRRYSHPQAHAPPPGGL